MSKIFHFIVFSLLLLFATEASAQLYCFTDKIVIYGAGDYVAYWGYGNDYNTVKNFPIGNKNKFNPAPINRGQPTQFQTGEHHFVFKTALPCCGELTWYLDNDYATAFGKDILLRKNDGRSEMPDTLGVPTTYTLTYKNLSDLDAFNVKLIDTIPAGTQYVSHTGNATVLGNVIIWNIGNLPIGGCASYEVSVIVTDTNKTKFKNVSWLYSNTPCGEFWSYSEDVNCRPSGGYKAGVESSYDMSWALFQRNFLINKGWTSLMVSNNTKILGGNPLSTYIPLTGPDHSSPIETTPFDILGISNATSAYAVDYMKGQFRHATIFSTTTNPPYVYSHSKTVCDRLAYSNMEDLDVVFINEKPFYSSTLINQKNKYGDASISFSIYETSSSFIVDSKWTLDQYEVPGNTIQVYNFQVWSPSVITTKELVAAIIEKFKSTKSISYSNDFLNTPSAYIQKASYTNDGKVLVTVQNFTNEAVTLNVDMKITRQQGMDEETSIRTISAGPGLSTHVINSGIMSSARISTVDNNGFKDNVFVGAGVFGSFAGPNSKVDEFSYVISPNIPKYPEGSLIYPGGAKVKGKLNDFLMIGRSLDASYDPQDLTKYDRFLFTATGTGKLKVYLEAVIDGKYEYPFVTVDLAGEKEYEIPLRTFKLNGNSVKLNAVTIAGFEFNKDFNPEVKYTEFTIKNIALFNNNNVAESVTPKEFWLYQNYPNPFNPNTFIKINVPKESKVKLVVYDALGREVAVILDRVMPPVSGYEVPFDASKLSSGIYYYRLISNGVSITKKMTLVK